MVVDELMAYIVINIICIIIVVKVASIDCTLNFEKAVVSSLSLDFIIIVAFITTIITAFITIFITTFIATFNKEILTIIIIVVNFVYITTIIKYLELKTLFINFKCPMMKN